MGTLTCCTSADNEHLFLLLGSIRHDSIWYPCANWWPQMHKVLHTELEMRPKQPAKSDGDLVLSILSLGPRTPRGLVL